MTQQCAITHADHEQIIHSRLPSTGITVIIGVYSTVLGPALGGVRFYPYRSEDDALRDVLRLSQAMAYKNAVAGLDFGGGKAVIVGDPVALKTESLLEEYGRLVESLDGRYITACDVGTTVSDMDVITRQCSHVVGSSRTGGAGDPSILTSYGVYRGMQACAEHRWGSPSMAGRRVGVAGVGKVGRLLVDRLLSSGAEVVVTDIRDEAVGAVLQARRAVTVVADTETLIRSDLDIFAPCALGGVLTDTTARQLRARIVCGAANNQLATDRVDAQLREAGILYAPDYVVNAGGVIQVADELDGGFVFDRARQRADHIYATTRQVLELAVKDGTGTAAAADRLARQRLTSARSRTTIETS